MRCTKCHRAPATHAVSSRTHTARPLRFFPSPRRPMCETCAERAAETARRVSRMEPGAVAFVLANGGRI